MSTVIVQPGRVQPGAPLVILGGAATTSPAPTAQSFRVALIAKLESITELTAIVGSAIYPGQLPETHDLGTAGPALTYRVPSNPRGHVLTGSDGTAKARVTFDAWAYDLSDADAITSALWNDLDGVPNTWGNGTCDVIACTQQDESDEHLPPKAGSDEWVYHITSQYDVKYRTGLPTLA